MTIKAAAMGADTASVFRFVPCSHRHGPSYDGQVPRIRGDVD